MKAALALAAAAIVLAAGGCAPAPPATPVAPSPQDVVFRVSDVSGFPLAPEIRGAEGPPRITVYGDGRVIRAGNEALFDQLVPELTETRVTPEALQDLSAFARATGVVRDGRLECPGLFDAGTTRIETSIEGQHHTLDVYALQTPCDGQDATQARLRGDAARFVDALAAIPEPARPVPFVPERALVLIGRRPTTGPAPEIPWPLASDLATLGRPGPPDAGWDRCTLLEGVDAATLWSHLTGATAQTRFIQDRVVYWVDARPLLPDEQVACPQ